MNMTDYFIAKEEYTELKLMLIKIAAMLENDEVYSKEMAMVDVLEAVAKIEEFEKPAKDVLDECTYKASFND